MMNNFLFESIFVRNKNLFEAANKGFAFLFRIKIYSNNAQLWSSPAFPNLCSALRSLGFHKKLSYNKI